MLSRARNAVNRVQRLMWMLLLAVLLTACAEQGPGFHATDITGANYGKDFRLVDSEGQLRTLADFRGKVVVVYFGFIQCPDVCPTALLRAVEAKSLLGDQGERMQVVYITVNPERDTPDIVKEYMAAFDPAFIGLHPTLEELPEVAKTFRVFYRKVPTGESYTMDHTATSFVYDTEGRLRLAIPHAQSAEHMAADLRTLLGMAK